MPKTEAQKREYQKKYREENKEKIKKQRREYREVNKKKIKEKRRKHYLENKEKINEKQKEYKEDNKDKIKERNKKYRESENGKKNRTISTWINILKIKFDDRNEAEFYYNSYINTHRCNCCDKDFKDSSERNMDHCHTCGLPRAIICRSCNLNDLVPCVNCLL